MKRHAEAAAAMQQKGRDGATTYIQAAHEWSAAKENKNNEDTCVFTLATHGRAEWTFFIIIKQ